MALFSISVLAIGPRPESAMHRATPRIIQDPSSGASLNSYLAYSHDRSLHSQLERRSLLQPVPTPKETPRRVPFKSQLGRTMPLRLIQELRKTMHTSRTAYPRRRTSHSTFDVSIIGSTISMFKSVWIRSNPMDRPRPTRTINSGNGIAAPH